MRMSPHAIAPLALPLLAAISACSTETANSRSQAAPPTPTSPASTQPASPAPTTLPRDSPMAPFARLISGEWKSTANSGTSMYDVWRWGPGHQSVRSTTHGFDGGGNPWRALQFIYWSPSLKRVKIFALNPFAESVSLGDIELRGDLGTATSDLFQTGNQRKTVQRWTFDGPDVYRVALFEDLGDKQLTPLTEWRYSRTQTLTPPETAAPAAPARWQAFNPLLGAWATDHKTTLAGAERDLHATFQWIPYVNAIELRVSATGSGKSEHVLDACFYRHPASNTFRCLALSSHGGVYEGEVLPPRDAASGFRINLTGEEGDARISYRVHIEVTSQSLRAQAWTGSDQTAFLDVTLTPQAASASAAPPAARETPAPVRSAR